MSTPVVRVWRGRADGQGWYATLGRLLNDDPNERTAQVAVRAAGRHVGGVVPEVTLDVPWADIEPLYGGVDAECVTCGQPFVFTREVPERTPLHYLAMPAQRGGLRMSDKPCRGVGRLLAVRVVPGTVKAARA